MQPYSFPTKRNTDMKWLEIKPTQYLQKLKSAYFERMNYLKKIINTQVTSKWDLGDE